MNRFFKKKLPGDQKPLLISLLAVAIVLVVLVAIDIFRDNSLQPSSINSDQNYTENELGDNVAEETPLVSPSGKDLFREEVPANITVPEMDTELNEEKKREIALPTVVVPAASGSESSFRSFAIIADNDTFSPLKIIAKVGDTVNISFSAVDKNYDIIFPSYNMQKTAKAGQTEMLQFNARKEGSFTYYCSICGGPEAGPKGNIIIVAE